MYPYLVFLSSGSASPEQAAVALGFVAHLVHLLAHFLIVPLQYPIRPNGSRSIIIDDVHDDQSLDIRELVCKCSFL